MALIFLGTDFHDTPLSDLEKFEANADRLLEALKPDGTANQGVVVLATCNRFELYLDVNSESQGVANTLETLTKELALEPEKLRNMLKVRTGNDVSAHLFAVAAGMQSMVIGEEEISGQVKRSLAKSQQNGFATKPLNHLFQKAASIAKDVSTNSGLGSSGRSIVTTALEIARSKHSETPWNSALLIGTGAYSRVVTEALKKFNLETIYVFSRSGRAEKFSQNHDTVPINASELESVLAEVPLVVSSSGSKGYAIDFALGQKIAELRSNQPELVMIDVSLSRDIEPAVGEIAGITIIDLETIKNNAPSEHGTAVDIANHIIEDGVQTYLDAAASKNIDPAISALREEFQLAVEQELTKLGKTSNAETVELVQTALRKVTNSLLHKPITRAKELAKVGEDQEILHALKVLFDIEVKDNA